MTPNILSTRYHGETFLEAMHTAIHNADHAAAWDIVRAAYQAGMDAATPIRVTLGEVVYPHIVGGRE